MILLLTALSIMLICCSPGQDKNEQGTNPITESEARNFITAYDGMWARRDTTAMKKTMADSYIYFTSTGTTMYRGRIISWFKPADKYIVDTAIRSEISVHLNGNTAIISSRWRGSGSFEGTRFRDDQRCSLVIQKIKGQLKLLSEHCTQVVK